MTDESNQQSENEQKKKDPRIPEFSTANGIDFGHCRRIGLVEPNFFEQLMTSKVRLYFAAMKIATNKTGSSRDHDARSLARIHTIVFPHNAPGVTNYCFNKNLCDKGGLLHLEDLLQLVTLFFVNPNDSVDKLAASIFGTSRIVGRSHVVAQWLLVQKRLNKFHQGMDVSSIEEATMEGLFSRLEEEMINQAEAIDDEAAVLHEERLGSDVAQNQHASGDDDMRHSGEGLDTIGAGSMRFSFMSKREEAHLAEDKEDFRVKAMSKLLDIDAINDADWGTDGNLFTLSKEDIEEMVNGCPEFMSNASKREESPVCECDSNDFGLAAAFPHIFMLGRAHGKNISSMTGPIRKHLLKQFTLIPGKDRRLLGHLFSCMQRARVARSVKAYVEGNSTAMERIRKLLEDPEEKKQFQDALAMPHLGKSKKVLQRYLGLLRHAGKKVEYGAVEGTTFKHHCLALTQRYSQPLGFLTISPNNLGNSRSVRLCFRTIDNENFPAVFQEGCEYGDNEAEFIRHLVEDAELVSQGMVHAPGFIGKSERAAMAKDNPVAFVQENKKLLFDVMDIILGLKLENKGFYSRSEGRSARKTRYYRTTKGAMGYSLGGTIGVTEDHHKGHLHFHITVNAGISAHALQRFACLPDLCSKISAALDSVYKSELQPGTHAAVTLRRHIFKKRKAWEIDDIVTEDLRMRDPLLQKFHNNRAKVPGFPMPPPRADPTKDLMCEPCNTAVAPPSPKSLQELDFLCETNGGQLQYHTHANTCHKGDWGRCGCRLNMPCALRSGTHPVILRPTNANDHFPPSTPSHSDESSESMESSGHTSLFSNLRSCERSVPRTNSTQKEPIDLVSDSSSSSSTAPSLMSRDLPANETSKETKTDKPERATAIKPTEKNANAENTPIGMVIEVDTNTATDGLSERQKKRRRLSQFMEERFQRRSNLQQVLPGWQPTRRWALIPSVQISSFRPKPQTNPPIATPNATAQRKQSPASSQSISSSDSTIVAGPQNPKSQPSTMNDDTIENASNFSSAIGQFSNPASIDEDNLDPCDMASGIWRTVESLVDEDEAAPKPETSTITYDVFDVNKHPLFEKSASRYKTKNVLDSKLPQSVVVWETSRKPITTPPFLLDDINEDNKTEFIKSLQELLIAAPPFNKTHSVFWPWMQTKATIEQLSSMQSELRNKFMTANGNVATFNPILSFLTGAHNNLGLLGSTEQAKSAMFYLVPYQGKNKFPIQQSLVVIDAAIKHCQKHESKTVKDDLGTAQRTSKQLLSRILNQMHLQLELSDYQIAAALLELPSTIECDKYEYGNPSALSSFRLALQMEKDNEDFLDKLYDHLADMQDLHRSNLQSSLNLHPNNIPNATQTVEDDNWSMGSFIVDDDDDSDDSDNDSSHSNASIDARDLKEAEARAKKHIEAPFNRNDLLNSLGYTDIIKLKNQLTPNDIEAGMEPRKIIVPKVSHCLHRGNDLKCLNYYEYLGCVRFEKEAAGKSKNAAQFPMDPAFEGATDCRHSIKLKQTTPILLGTCPAHPGEEPLEPLPHQFQTETRHLKRHKIWSLRHNVWKKKANDFARYHLLLFRPETIHSNFSYTWNDLVHWTQQLTNDH